MTIHLAVDDRGKATTEGEWTLCGKERARVQGFSNSIDQVTCQNCLANADPVTAVTRSTRERIAAARLRRQPVAVYARVSTGHQSTTMQLRELRAFCKRRGFTIVKEYVDRVTGVLTSRRRRRRDQAYVDLMNDAVQKKFTCVVVWKFDRFARSLSGLIEGLQTFQGLGIDFISVTEAIDTTTPQGRMVFNIVACFAEFEREMIVDRVRAGLANARARGTRLGRPRDIAVQDAVYKLHDRGFNVSRIAREAKCSRAGVRKILERRAAIERATRRKKTP